MRNEALIAQLRDSIRAIEAGESPHGQDEAAEAARAPRKRGTSGRGAGGDGQPASPRGSAAVNPDASSSALSKIVALVNVSERSEHAVRERLARDGFPEGEIDEAVARAIGYGFIDDMRFASVLIRSRMNQGKGADGIRRELGSHGIDIEDVPGWPFEFCDPEDEQRRALAFITSHPTKARNKRDGAYRKLVQRGFSASVAAQAAREWSEGIEAS